MSTADATQERLSLARDGSTLTAEELHQQAVSAFREGNRARLQMICVLRELADRRLYHELGYSTLAGYARACFGYRRSHSNEFVRVARALDTLPLSAESFVAGDLGWSALRQITRVANQKTEEEWIDYAEDHTVDALRAEVQDALAKGRDVPRGRRFGLPSLEKNVSITMSRGEFERFCRALDRLRPEVSEKLGVDQVSQKDLLLYVCERLLESGHDELERRAANGPGRSGIYAVVYHVSADAESAGIMTDDGLVEVPVEEAERVAGDDRPTSPELREKIARRDGYRCANPNCTNGGDHCHHIVFRCKGGQSIPENEVLVCATCHALIHQGLLKVRGRVGGAPGSGLTWTTRASEMRSRVRDRHAERQRARAESALRVASAEKDQELVEALMKLKFKAPEAWAKLRRARAKLGDEESLDESTLLREALRDD